MLISDLVLAIVFTAGAAGVLFLNEEKIETWSQKQSRSKRVNHR